MIEAAVSGIMFGMVLSMPIWLLYATARILVKTIGRSKLSLDDYLKLMEEMP